MPLFSRLRRTTNLFYIYESHAHLCTKFCTLYRKIFRKKDGEGSGMNQRSGNRASLSPHFPKLSRIFGRVPRRRCKTETEREAESGDFFVKRLQKLPHWTQKRTSKLWPTLLMEGKHLLEKDRHTNKSELGEGG